MGKQADGRYRSKVVVGKRADGRNIVKWIQGTTKKELEQNRQRILAEYRDGVASERRNVLATDWIYQYFDHSIAPGQKPATAEDIRSQIDRYIFPHLRDKQLRAISLADIQSCVNACAGKCRSIHTNVMGVLRRSFAAAVAEGYIDRDVTAACVVRLPERRHNRAFTPEEMAILKRNVAERKIEPLLTALLFYTGMRRGELIGLQWKEVDLKNDVIRVRRDFDWKENVLDTLKTPNAKRDIPIVPELREILEENKGPREGFVVHAPTDPMKALPEATYKRRWKAVRELIGAEDVTARTFRNNFATVLYDAGVDVLTASRAMGHADPSTTLKIYTDIERSRKVKKGAAQVKAAFAEKTEDEKTKVARKLPNSTAFFE